MSKKSHEANKHRNTKQLSTQALEHRVGPGVQTYLFQHAKNYVLKLFKRVEMKKNSLFYCF